MTRTAPRASSLTPRWRKVHSDLRDDKTRTGLVVASISVGVFAIGMIITAFVILGQDINRSYASVHPPNIVIWTDPFDKALVQSIARLPGVRNVAGRRTVPIRARRGEESWLSLQLVGLADYSGDINQLKPIEGRATPADDEVVISQKMSLISGYKPGDQLQVELPNGSKHPLTVVGLVTDQTTSKPEANALNNAFITLKTLRSFGLDGTFNQLYVTVEGDGSDRAAIAGVSARIQDQLERSQREVHRVDERLTNEHPMIQTILAVIGVLGALGVLVLILSSSLIINTLNALLTQQSRQIGIMKLVGARSRQIMGMYLTLIIAYGLIGLALAIPLGSLAGYGLAAFIANLMGASLQGFRLVPAAILAQTLVAILVPLGAGFVPVHSGAKTSVEHAISRNRPGNAAKGKGRFHLNTLGFHWISRPILLSFRNTFRKRVRLSLTLFTLTMAGAVFIAVFNVRDSMGGVMDQLMQHFLGDVTVTLRQPYRVDEVRQGLLAIPGVVAVEGWGGGSGEIQDANGHVLSKLSISAPPQDTQLLHPDFVAGRWLLPGEKQAMVVSDAIYKLYPDLKPGDNVLVKLPDRREEPWQVVGVFRFVSMLGDPLAYANYEYIAERTHTLNESASYRVVTRDHDKAAQEALTRRIDDDLRRHKFLVQGVQSGSLLRVNATRGVDTLTVFLLIMAILAAFVGSIGLTGAMSINVLERTREIGVMRTIGAADRVIMQSVVFEALVIGMITWLLAVLLSVPISLLLLTIVGKSMMGSAIALKFTPVGSALWFALVLVLSIVASILPARNAARLTINEVLAYE